MPTYTFRNKETGEEKDMIMSISSMEEMKESEEWEKIFKGAPTLVTSVGGTLSKAGHGWKDTLNRIKKGSGRGNTINS